MANLIDTAKALLDKLQGVLEGEPARFIGYGAGLIVYAVARAFDVIPDVPLDVALAETAFYVTIVAAVVESIRHFVYSPASAKDLLDLIDELEQELRDATTGPKAGV